MVSGIICGLGVNGYILAINAMHDLLKMEIDKKIIQKLIQTLEELKKSIKDKDFSKIEIKDEIQEIVEETGTVIKSPIVGTAYLAPEPGAKKFVEVGKKIKKEIV